MDETKAFRILLTNLPNPQNVVNATSYFPARLPLALNQLKASIESVLGAEARVDLLDIQNSTQADRLLSQLEPMKYDLVGISVCSDQAKILIDLLKKIYGSLQESDRPRLVLGNTYPTFDYAYLLKCFPSLYIIRGEGEYGIVGLIEAIQGRERIESVPNLAYQDKGRMMLNDTKPVNLLTSRMPSAELVKNISALDGKVYVEGSRGCSWGNCSFCNRHRYCSGWRPYPIDYVLSVLDSFASEGARDVVFADEDFVGESYERAIEIAQGLIDLPYSISFRLNLKVRNIVSVNVSSAIPDRRLDCIESLLRAGLRKVFIGVESGSASQLKRYRKGHSVEDCISAIRILRRFGVDFTVGFIMFDPFTTIDELLENIEFLEHADVASCATVLNSLRLTDDNTWYLSKVREAGIGGQRNSPNIYHEWSFQDADVSEIHTFLMKWQSARTSHYENLRSRLLSSERSQAIRQSMKAFRKILLRLKALNNEYDFAFLKLLVGCKARLCTEEWVIGCLKGICLPDSDFTRVIDAVYILNGSPTFDGKQIQELAAALSTYRSDRIFREFHTIGRSGDIRENFLSSALSVLSTAIETETERITDKVFWSK